ncbi:MAG TPA: DUF1800 domain-containing protein [Sphingomonas sp.]|uniref:DUF1800 domain-containing protein n=1 Tax=Sphingomonas sp. TaxID=28214 RepID=UPI002ED8E529
MSRAPAAAAIAQNRFGLGARDADAAIADPHRWLTDQLDRYDPRPAALRDQPDGRALLLAYGAVRRDATTEAERMTMRQDANQAIQAAYRAAVNARTAAALATPTPFPERLVHFWSNHFALSADKPQVTALAAAFEAEAIRPHLLGRFEDMLVAVAQHPAMLYYLDQDRSIGGDSPAALRAAARMPARRRGLNENLAREILELHTLGVRSGYGQADVTAFAEALTGWSVACAQEDTPGQFLFRAGQHQPGPRTLLGRRYAQPGVAQGRAVLADLAASPATARHVATKLARHFSADTPPPGLVTRLEHAYRDSGGDLPTLYRTLVHAPEPWAVPDRKFKTPWEWLLSSLRATGRQDLGTMQVAALMTQLGQPIWKPGAPAGYDDVAAGWAAPDALLRRVELAPRLVAPIGDRLDPVALARRLLPGLLAPATEQALARAESRASGLALLLVSPEFLRR